MEITKTTTYRIHLEGSHCETCGYNYEEIEVEVDQDTLKVPRAHVSVGCYNGDTIYDASIDDAISLLSEWTHLDPDVKKLIRELRDCEAGIL